MYKGDVPMSWAQLLRGKGTWPVTLLRQQAIEKNPKIEIDPIIFYSIL
jgi:hypothetical protein